MIINLYYFIQKDRSGNLILSFKIDNPPSTNSYIIEEYNTDTNSSKFIPYNTTNYNAISISSWPNIKERQLQKPFLILNMLGYNSSSNPSANKIIRNTTSRSINQIDLSREIVQDYNNQLLNNEFNNDVLSNPRKHKLAKHNPIKRCSCKKK